MRTKTFFIGITACFAFSWIGLAVLPNGQLGGLGPQIDEEAGEVFPLDINGLVERGRTVYVSQGCVHCHTQVVRDGFNGGELSRQWGVRRTVPRDYIYGSPALGDTRNGPDLANVGARITDAQWHYQHLYDPRSVFPKSFMPSFRHLFSVKKVTGQISEDAVKVTGKYAPAEGMQVVPSPDAKALVAYLLSLDHSYSLQEAPAKKEEAAK